MYTLVSLILLINCLVRCSVMYQFEPPVAAVNHVKPALVAVRLDCVDLHDRSSLDCTTDCTVTAFALVTCLCQHAQGPLPFLVMLSCKVKNHLQAQEVALSCTNSMDAPGVASCACHQLLVSPGSQSPSCS